MTRLNCLAKEDIVAGRCCQYLEILATRLKGAFTHTKMNIHNNPTSHTYFILLPTSGLSVGLQFSGTTIGNACGKYVPYTLCWPGTNLRPRLYIDKVEIKLTAGINYNIYT